MAILTEEMQRVVREQRLGFHATVCPDGSPNLSPKGTTDVWDADHLWFAEICSPQTLANIRAGSLVEVNVVDPFLRKGYRFKGAATVHEPGSDVFVDGIERLRAAGSALLQRVNAVVLIEVQPRRGGRLPRLRRRHAQRGRRAGHPPGSLRPPARAGGSGARLRRRGSRTNT